MNVPLMELWHILFGGNLGPKNWGYRCCSNASHDVPRPYHPIIFAHPADTRHISSDAQLYFLCSGHKMFIHHKGCARRKTTELPARQGGSEVSSNLVPRRFFCSRVGQEKEPGCEVVKFPHFCCTYLICMVHTNEALMTKFMNPTSCWELTANVLILRWSNRINSGPCIVLMRSTFTPYSPVVIISRQRTEASRSATR